MDHEENIQAVGKRLDRPLWVVTAGDSRERGGLIATWITQSSLDPAIPTVTAGIAPNHFTCELIDRVGSFGLHLLRVDQTEFIERFADGSGRERDKLTGLALREPTHTEGAEPPILKDCLAWLDCRVTARLGRCGGRTMRERSRAAPGEPGRGSRPASAAAARC